MSHPERLGKYLVTEVLGEGAMGVVYKGWDPDIRRVVALKTIRRHLDDGTDSARALAARFRNEAQAAGRLSHPGIVGVYEYGEDRGIAYIAMEYVQGHSLAHHARQRLRFTDADIPGVMCQLLDALDHAHSQGVWHRDIKPGNVIMAGGGRLKVADFGIARIEGAGLTQVTTLIGTPGSMAPEQFLGRAIDHRIDIYAAGVLLYILLTGRPPFLGTPESLMYRVVHEPPEPPSTLPNAQRPAFYDRLVATALAKQPDQRFASAAAFKAALVSAVGEPIDASAWERTIVSAPAAALPGAAAAGIGTRTALDDRAYAGSAAGGGMTASLPSLSASPLDRAALEQAGQALARLIGPLASVLVRRAARDCSDLPTLHARLAEQIPDPAARTGFLAQMGHGGHGGTAAGGATQAVPATGYGGAPPAAAPTPDPTAPAAEAALTDDFVEQATRLLAQRIGPIAKVVAKKAAARSRGRESFCALVVDAVDEPAARAGLAAELRRLG